METHLGLLCVFGARAIFLGLVVSPDRQIDNHFNSSFRFRTLPHWELDGAQLLYTCMLALDSNPLPVEHLQDWLIQCSLWELCLATML